MGSSTGNRAIRTVRIQMGSHKVGGRKNWLYRRNTKNVVTLGWARPRQTAWIDDE